MIPFLYLASKIQILCDCALASIMTETMFSSSLLLFPTTLIKGWLHRVIVAMLKILNGFIGKERNTGTHYFMKRSLVIRVEMSSSFGQTTKEKKSLK